MNIISPDAPHSLRILAMLPSIPLGGMERAAIRVMQEMQTRGADVHVLTNRRWGKSVQREVKAAGLSQTGICHVHGLGRPRTALELRAAAVSFLMTERELVAAHRRHNANALLASSFNVAWFARKLARRPDTVSVFRIPNPPIIRQSGSKARINRVIWRAIGRSFDHLVCNSYYTAGMVADAIGDRGKVRVVRNFPPSLNRHIETPAPELPQGRQRILFLGQIAAHKGVDILFDAAQRLFKGRDDVDVVLAGPSIYLDPYPNTLAARIDAAGLANRFQLLGAVDDVQGFLRQGDVHVCPSTSSGDSFPNVILDAKQASLPSVVLPTAGLPEAVEHGINGLVTPDHSAETLAEALAALLDDPKRRTMMGAAAYASLSHFDPDTLSARWFELFSSKQDKAAGDRQ
jgi:glycosyltransferase involved in cell wall biosynthesis